MTSTANIYLVGPMGSGKSAVGRRVAKLMGMAFRDNDEEIEQRTGVDIPLIFEKEGEAGFRRREAAVLADMVRESGIVLATGGGTPMNPDSRSLLAAGGRVVYLYTSVAEQVRRTSRTRHRPLLDVDDPEEVLTRLFAERDPVYRQLADVVVATDGRHVNTVARDIVAQLKQLGRSDAGLSEPSNSP
ncbi:MAG: shikimate kinase AroK [Gammaproteobacteria bacterium]|jgi:shikimate kinase|nr:shikimate kinase AroK [Gammaproteobacteria bacterium]